MKKIILCLILTLIMAPKLSFSSENYYVFEKNDNLTVVLYSIFLKRIYGSESILSQTYEINKELESANSHILPEGQKIYLPDLSMAHSCNFEIDSNQQVHIKHKIKTNAERIEILDQMKNNCNGPHEVANLDSSEEVNIHRAPAAVKVESPVNKSKDKKRLFDPHQIHFSPHYGVRALKVRDIRTRGVAGVGAKTTYGINLDYQHYFSKSFGVTAFGGLRYNRFTTNAVRPLVKETFYTHHYGIGIFGKFFNQSLLIGANANYQQKVFLMGLTATALSIDRHSLPQLQLYGDYNFWNYQGFRFFGNADVVYTTYLKTSAYKIKDGLGFGVGLDVKRKFEDFELTIGPRYIRNWQNTDFTQQKEIDARIRSLITLSF